MTPRTAFTFPDGFLWGTATAAHQIEGGNVNSDWWAFEHDPESGCADVSGDACDSYHRFGEDHRIVADLGLGAYRFSIEWARVEPEEGEYSNAQLDYYRRVVESVREHGLVPVVTLHHFTHPRWFAERGHWEAGDAPDLFGRYCERVMARLGDAVGYVCTLNEPNVVATMGWRFGLFPPRVRDRDRRAVVNDRLVAAHRRAVDVVRQATGGSVPVGLTVSATDYQVQPGGEAWLERLRGVSEDVFYDATGGDDFVGVQTYTRELLDENGHVAPPEGARRTQMGYEFYPEALAGTVRRAHERTGGVPVFVTENGIGTADDAERVEYVERALEGLASCVEEGIPVIGYTYWSLLDNFEWVLGYDPTFGIVEVDRETFERRPKPSASFYGSIARANGWPGEG